MISNFTIKSPLSHLQYSLDSKQSLFTGPLKNHYLAAIRLEEPVVLRIDAPHSLCHLAREANRRRHRLRIPPENITEVDVEQVSSGEHHDVVQMPISNAQLERSQNNHRLHNVCLYCLIYISVKLGRAQSLDVGRHCPNLKGETLLTVVVKHGSITLNRFVHERNGKTLVITIQC